MALVRVVGAGPAGSSAALSALAAGAVVHIYEKSPFPRHKVCGEFLSPETARLIDSLGLTQPFLDLQPTRLQRMTLVFGSRERTAPFPEPAYGLSRHALDQLLLTQAQSRGAVLHRQLASDGDVIAVGRKDAAPKGRRLFGFKAHFTGPVNDAMELYFLPGYSYVGVSAIENGATNVCGLAEESALSAVDFDIDQYLHRHAPLSHRLQPLRRSMNWMKVGPLVFGNRFQSSPSENYPAGDQLSFVDPFTGSGILSAILTGTLAGRAAAEQSNPQQHIRNCQSRLQGAFLTSALLRAALKGGWGQSVAPWLPPKLLFQITRPRL